jgi:ribosome-associated protein
MKTISISHQPVELYKILKFESLVNGGGEAKMVIAAGMVTLNSVIETQKRKKVHAGDIIGFDGEHFKIALQSTGIQPAASTVQASVTENPIIVPTKKSKRSAIRF